MAEIPRWHVRGDWFDVCNCNIQCPCTFGFTFEWAGRSSKHIPFDWSGPG